MIRPKVLVLLAAHNGAKWITQQIETILNQANVDLELVISDDGSSDATRERISQFATDGRVRVVSPPAPTGSAAQNFLWLIRTTSAATHDFVAFSDQDDIWLEDKLSRACSALDRPNAAGYSCAVTAFWEGGRERTLTPHPALTELDFMFESAGQGCTYVLTANFFFRIQQFFRLNAAQTQALHYHDWTIYALSRAYKLNWFFDPLPMVRYRQHQSNDTGARVTPSGIGKRLRLIKNSWYRRQIAAIAGLCVVAAPADKSIANWKDILLRPPSFSRQLTMARICLKGGRRRALDNVILIGAVLGGWV